MISVLLGHAALFLSGCHHREPSPPPRVPPALSATDQQNAVKVAQTFVDAVNQGNTAGAADLVDWERWVAEDAALQFLVAEIRRQSTVNPLTPESLERQPFEGSPLTVRDLLSDPTPHRTLAALARERFIAGFEADFASMTQRRPAALLTYHLDRIDRSATIAMPDGELLELTLVRRRNGWRLLPAR